MLTALALGAACSVFAARLAVADEAPLNLADLAQARFVHCAFYKHYEPMLRPAIR